MKNITFRTIQKSDYNAIADIISDTWGYQKFCSEKTAHKMGLLYLASCLCEQTFNTVAVMNNKVVGIIMGKDLKNSNISFTNIMFLVKSSLRMILSAEGRKVLKMFNGFSTVDKCLLKESKQEFDGVLSFFVVKEETRGTGVGGKLYENLMDYFQSHNIENFYLFTDTSCNFHFYEYKGAKRIGEKMIDLKPYDSKSITFFLYAKAVAMDKA